MSLPKPTLRRAAVLTTAVAAVIGTCLIQAAAAPAPRNPLRGVAKIQAQQHAAASQFRANAADADGSGREEGDALEVADQAEQYAMERSAPADSASAQALL